MRAQIPPSSSSLVLRTLEAAAVALGLGGALGAIYIVAIALPSADVLPDFAPVVLGTLALGTSLFVGVTALTFWQPLRRLAAARQLTDAERAEVVPVAEQREQLRLLLRAPKPGHRFFAPFLGFFFGGLGLLIAFGLGSFAVGVVAVLAILGAVTAIVAEILLHTKFMPTAADRLERLEAQWPPVDPRVAAAKGLPARDRAASRMFIAAVAFGTIAVLVMGVIAAIQGGSRVNPGNAEAADPIELLPTTILAALSIVLLVLAAIVHAMSYQSVHSELLRTPADPDDELLSKRVAVLALRAHPLHWLAFAALAAAVPLAAIAVGPSLYDPELFAAVPQEAVAALPSLLPVALVAVLLAVGGFVLLMLAQRNQAALRDALLRAHPDVDPILVSTSHATRMRPATRER